MAKRNLRQQPFLFLNVNGCVLLEIPMAPFLEDGMVVVVNTRPSMLTWALPLQKTGELDNRLVRKRKREKELV